MLKTGDKLNNFTVTRIRDSKELSGRLVELKHDRLGTEVVWLDNNDANKLFSISFETLPTDSTGVFHILEHSVLCGSEKYPVKEPFVDLLKSSMNTFLNALTFQDKTMYPVSSRNEQDYLNLTSVYLDAVFAPAILKNKNIFYQEGWHIEQDENGKLSYKGVVFNEMKGAMASRDELIIESMLAMLFKDNCYGFNSGGDPEIIPTLTYEKFVDTYKKYYHPSNAKIYLDGSVPLEKTLELVDSYCSRYDQTDFAPKMEYQRAVSAEKTIYYALSEDEDIKDKTQLCLAKITGRFDDPVKNLATGVVFNALSDSNDAPFKKALFEQDLAEDLEMMVNDEAAQTFISIDVKNIKDGKEKEVIETIKNVAKEQIEKGIDRKALIASINALEYKIKAPIEPAGLMRGMKCLVSWLYGGDPLTYLEYDEYFKKLREYLDTNKYEELLKEAVLEDEGMCILKALPSYTASLEKDKAEEARLEKIKASWSKEELEKNIKLNKELLLWQQTEDTKEQTDTIPTLALSAVSKDAIYYAPIEEENLGVKTIRYNINANGIVHFNMYFNLSNRSLGELRQIGLMGQLLSYLPTKEHSALELEQEIKTYIGDLNFRVTVASKKNDNKLATPYLAASCSVLKENLSHAEELIKEILSSTVFDKEKVLSILKQNDIHAREAMTVSGHAIGKLVVDSHYSAAGAVAEVLSGYDAITWSHEIVDKYDRLYDTFADLMEHTLSRACSRSRLTITYASNEKIDFSSLVSKFDEGGPIDAATAYHPSLPKKIAIKIPAQVGFAVQGNSLAAINEKYDGSLAVASNILTLDYLWNKVRVQGGAYGTGIKALIGGSIYSYSYRDPNLFDSIEVNKGAGDHLRKLCKEKAEIDKYIISAIAATEPLLSPHMALAFADRDYFTGYTKEDVNLQREQMLGTSYEKLMHAADVFDKFAEDGSLCVIGPEEKLKDFKGFDILEA